MKKVIFYAGLFLLTFLLTWKATAQVGIAPYIHPQFVDSNGVVLSGGFLYTYAAGTTTLQATFIDFSGTIANPNPIPLDASGSPSNGSVQTQIWLSNITYKFCAYNSAMVQQWCADNIQGTFNVLNTNNTWSGTNIFTQPIQIQPIDGQIITGFGNTTTLDFPPPIVPITLTFPTTADTMVGRATTDTLSNKTLLSPQITSPTINGTLMANSPGTYISLANNTINGTGFNLLTSSSAGGQNAQGSATLAGSSGGVLGICVALCGTTGTANIQQSGTAYCNFDGVPTVGDYVQISTVNLGNCHDSGASYPSNGQVIGRVTSSVASGSAYFVDLFGPEIKAGATEQLLIADATTSSGTFGDTAFHAVKAMGTPFAANSLNTVGKTIRITGTITVTPASSMAVDGYISFGTTNSLGGTNIIVYVQGTALSITTSVQMTCTVSSTGVTGNLNCAMIPYNGLSLGTSSASITANLTVPLYIGTGCAFASSNAGNACSSNLLTVEQLN